MHDIYPEKRRIIYNRNNLDFLSMQPPQILTEVSENA